jgi:membrane fusion protein
MTPPSSDTEPPFLEQDPPPLVARALSIILIVLFGIVVAALVLVTVPETVHAPFRLVPVRAADPVRALHDGVVRDVRVLEAQRVTAGEPMFVIASEPVADRASERRVLQEQLGGTGARLANERLRYESQRLADEKEQGRLADRLRNLARQRTLKEQQAALARQVAERQERSHREGLTSWVETSVSQLQANRLAVEVEQVETEQAETQAALEKLRYEMAARAAGYTELQRSVREENARAGARKGMLDRETARDTNELAVDAPCTGTVVRLRVQAPGAVVLESDVLAEVACAGARLQAELLLPQQGLARVGPGQPVKLMYDAFPYQRYGVRYGTVRWVSPASGDADSTSFRVFAELGENVVRVQGESRPLAPGMGGRAAIIVGRRSLVSYAFEPIRQLRENLASGR